MSFFRRLLGKKNQTREGEPEGVHLAFVLLPEEHLPSAEKIVACYKTFVPAGESICRHQDAENDNASEQVLSFDFNSEGSALVALVPAAVPNREADEGTQFSVSSLGTDWTLPEHEAHLVVTTPPSSSLSKVEQLSRFTSLLAAVAKASNAVGIYWGSAGATHDADFFTSVAAEHDIVPRIMLWSGISVAREKDGRLSLLSLGMEQLDLPDLLLVVSQSSEGRALETFFDLLAYVAKRGQAIPEGDTVGRTGDEKLLVRYVRSPIDKAKQVWRIELS